MSAMIERVAKAIAYSYGARIVGPSQSMASRELGWKPDGEHLAAYADKHWREWRNEAVFAIQAMREPTEAMVACIAYREMGVLEDVREAWRDAIDAALS